MKSLVCPIFLTIFLLISGKDLTGQVAVSASDTADYPYWVQMMQVGKCLKDGNILCKAGFR
jgi:hypothetical protein